MKTNKRLLILVIIGLLSIKLIAQTNVSLSIYQDAKLLVTGDDRGNDAGTINILARVKMQGNQDKHGYLIVFPEWEYAELVGGRYARYSANVGYVFNKLIVDNFEATASLGYGWIDRYNGAFWSVGGSAELAYKINDTFKFSILAQATERKDLSVIWNDNAIRLSGFIGLEINIL